MRINNVLLNHAKHAGFITKVEVISRQATAQIDYQIQVEDIISRKGDGEDITFAQKNQILNHWKESYVSWKSDAWAKLPKLPVTKSQILNVLSGNPSASSASNGTDTFEAYYEAGGAGWTTVDPNSRLSQSGRTLTFTNLYRTESTYVYKKISVGNFVAEYAFTFTGGHGDEMETCIGHIGLSNLLGAFSGWTDDSVSMDFYYSTDGPDPTIRVVSVKDGTSASAIQSTKATKDTKYWYRLIKNDATPITKLERYTDEFITLDQEASVSTYVPTAALTYAYPIVSPGSGFSGYYVSGSVEDFRVRNRTSPEPLIVKRKISGKSSIIKAVCGGIAS